MKKINLIEWLSRNSHEKQKPQRFARYAAMLIMLLTLGVGQMWADGGDFYNMYIAYSFEGAGGAIDGDDNNTGVTVDAGTLTSGSLTLTGVYLKCWDDWGSNYKSSGGLLGYTNKGGSAQELLGFTRSGKSGNNYEYQNASPSLTIASYTQASGSYAFECWGKTWGWNDGDRYFPKSSGHYVLNYKIAPPVISSFSVSGSGYISGAGTSGDPYIVEYNSGTLTLTVNGSKAHTDGNSTLKYWKDSGAKQNSNTLTVTGITSSDLQSVVVHAQCINNSDASLVGTESNATIYYKAGYAITPVAKYTTDGSTYTTGTTGGTVTINGSSSAIGVVKDATYSIVATPASGYCVEEIKVGETVAWEQANDNNRQTAAKTISTYTATADKTVTVKFARIQNITLHIHNGGVGGLVLQNATPKVGAHTVSLPNTTLTSEGNGWYYHTFDNVTSVTVLNVACSNTGAAAVANGGQPISTYTLSQTEYFSAIHSQNDGSSNICNVLGVSYTNQSYSIGSPAITLNPTYTLAPSGSPTYSWSVTSQPVGGAYSLSATNVASPTFSSTVEGTYTLNVQVTTGGCTKSTSFNVEVANGVPDPEISGATFVTNPILSNAHLQISVTYANIPAEGCYIRLKHDGYWNDENNSAWTALSSGSGSMTFTTNNINVPTGTWTIELYNNAKNLLSSTNVTGSLSVLTAQTITISAGANGSVSPTTVYAGSGYRSESFTATPNDHYHFVNWSNNNSSNVTVNDVNSATTYVSTAAAAATITANFAGDQYSITYKDQGDVAFSGSHVDSPSAHPTTHTYGAATTLNSATKTGYTFGGWFTSSACTGDAVTTLGATAYSDDITLYAKWTENTTTVTVNVSPANSGTLTVGGSAFTPGNTTTAGVATSRTVVASANSGYGFDYWTTSGNATGSASTNTYTLAGNGNGSTGTLTANFYTKVNSGWYMKGAAFGGLDMPTTYPFDRAYRDVANTYYRIVTLTASSYWKVHDGTTTYNTDGSTSSDKLVAKNTVYSLTSNNSKSSYTNTTMTDVWVVVNTSTKKLWIQDATTYYTITFANGSSGNTNNGAAGTEGTITTKTSNYGELSTKKFASGETIKLNVSAKTGYVIDDITIGETSVATDVNSTSYSGNTTMPAGDATLKVTYKHNYTVTYGVGTSYTSMGSASTSPSVTSGNYVIAGTNITFTATPNLGYKFVGWYSNADCTGDAVSTNASYTIASLAANTTLYAKFELLTLYMNSDINNWASEINLTHTTENAAIYTYTGTLNANPTNDAAYATGWHFEYCYNTARSEKAYQYTSVQTPTYSGSSIDGVNTYSGANTIQFGLTRKSDVTITLTLQTAPTKPTLNIAADPYYMITYGVPTHGSYTIQVGSAAAVGASTESTAGKTITLVPSASTGYHFDSWTVTKAGGGTVTVTSNQFTMPSDDVTIAATFLPTSYDVTLKPNGATTGSDQVVRATFDAAMPTTTKSSVALAAPTKTGYTLQGFYQNSNGTGTKYYNANMTSANNWDQDGNANIWAKWQANPYVVTLDVDETNQGNIEGATTRQDVTYDGATTTVPNRPTAANGYALVGYYTEQLGEGTKLINADGTWIAGVLGYTDEDAKWVFADDLTLYAYYKKAEITALVASPGVIAPSGTVTITPTIEPTPTGTTKVCYELQYSNGTPLPSQPEFSSAGGNAVSFTAPAASATYIIQATLETGDDCGNGTELSTRTTTFQVAGEHTVTVRYQDSDGRTLAASEEIAARPLTWTTDGDIMPPTITGYTFVRWDAGDGVTIKNGDSDPVTTTTTSSIQIKAVYDGTLTAVYTKKRLIFFNNTLGWSNVYVYFYKNGSYWDKDNGTGANTSDTYTDTPYSEGLHGEMTQIEGTNIFYFDAEAAGVNASYINVAFTELDQHGYHYFAKTGDVKNKVIRRGDYSTTLPMFVPLEGIEPTEMNSQLANYYNKGYWMNYPENTGYTLHIYDSKTYGSGSSMQVIPFEFNGDKTMPMTVKVELNANREYGYEIHRADGNVYGNDSKVLKINDSGEEDPEGLTASQRGGIQTSVAGDYEFTLNYGEKGVDTYKYLIGVHYPVAANDYRIVYTDEATWSKDAHTSGWYHPSRAIHKEEGSKDIVSFYVSKAGGANAGMKFQYASAIEPSTGVVTWTDVPSGTIDLSGITESGVYNFHLTQDASSISVEKIEPYTGNYYIRTDCAGNSKWENFRTLDHQMTYSDYAEEYSGYSHYYAHWVTSGTNVKFCIANDYSQCITDTLVEDYGTVIANINASGTLESASANIRFMWNQSTNKVSRAYIGGSTYISDRFLVLEGDSKMYDEDGSALSISGLDPNQANLIDVQNFVYERTIQVNTQARAKLTAKYNNNIQYFKGSEGTFAEGTTIELLGGDADGKHTMRIVYDFKTNRLVTAYVPSGTINAAIAINADLMIVREHQGAGQQLLFEGDGALSEVHTVYGVMRFNRWTLNNKEKTGSHDPVGDPKSAYERGLYWISFPFDVNLSDVFGFGTYGTHWIIMEYDGAERASKGYWKDSEGFWKYVTNRTDKVLKAGKGYVLALDLDLMKSDNTSFWTNNIEQVELFFPSAKEVENIEATDVSTIVPEHECTIDRRTDKTSPDINKDRRIADGNWNIIGVPSYANYGTTLKDGSNETIYWNANPESDNLPFLYEWSAVDNTYSVQSGTTYPFKAMHAYMVQYHGDLYWSLASATPVSPIVARRTYAEKPQNVEMRIELLQNEKAVDQTFVKLSNDENVSTNFAFDEDLCKEYNANKANIYTIVENYLPVAGNTMPMSDQTTVVPVGVKIAADGEYTFAIPEGTGGIGVVLIDNIAGTRTNLGLMDYSVTLEQGQIDNRFLLEISPIVQSPTGIELLNGENGENGVRKVLIDNILYIVKDGIVYDAQGHRVQ